MSKISKSPKELKTDIMQACVLLFNKKGLKFTMDDVAKQCHSSKKTMYLIFNDKEELFLAMVDYVFDNVKLSESEVVSDKTLSFEDKLRKLLGVLPEGYTEIDFTQLYSLKDKYPNIYAKVALRLESGWDASIALIEEGKKQGLIRADVHTEIIKMMFESSLEKFFQSDVLVKNKISYNNALKEVVNIIVDGVMVKEKEA